MPEPTPHDTAQTAPQHYVPTEGQAFDLAAFAGRPVAARSKPGYETWARMQHCPSLALARVVRTAPIRTANIVPEIDDDLPDDAEDLLRKQWQYLGASLLDDLCYSLDYGFAAFELVWEYVDGALLVTKAKPLRADWTKARVDKTTGAFEGILNEPPRSQRAGGHRTVLDPEHSLWCANEPYCGNWYGFAELETARTSWDAWRDANDRLSKYLIKSAAPIPLIEHPEGHSIGPGGSRVQNSTIARALLDQLGHCGGVAMPSVQSAWREAAARQGMDPSKLKSWHIDFIESRAGAGGEFVAAIKLYETQMFRARIVPERAATEGEHGTKAEAETHGALVDTAAGVALSRMLQNVNRYVADRVMLYNYGPQAVGRARYGAAALDAATVDVRRALVQSLLGAPINYDVADSLIDLPSVLESVGLPVRIEDGAAVETGDAATLPTVPDELAPEAMPSTVPVDDVAQTALNGAQVQALSELAAQVASGQLPMASARAIAAAAFPAVAPATLDAVFDPLTTFTPEKDDEA